MPSADYHARFVSPQFETFMDPCVMWLADPAYTKAFAEITGDTTMTEVGFTKPSEQGHPGFINAQLADDDTMMLLTVRGDPTLVGQLPGETPGHVTGAVTQLRIPLDDWDQFVIHAQQMRSRAGDAT